jgi:hypothetical protein
MKGGYTAKQAAYDIAMGWVKAVFEDRTADVDKYATTEEDRRRIRQQLAKLHNRMLSKSTLDGLPLDESPRNVVSRSV